jgi:hypothetical protein
MNAKVSWIKQMGMAVSALLNEKTTLVEFTQK